MPKYEIDAMRYVAGKVDKLHEEFKNSKAAVTGIQGNNPFGEIRHPDDHDHTKPPTHPMPSDNMANGVGKFTEGAQGEFEAGANHMAATSDFLRTAASMMEEQDNQAGDALKRTEKQ
ncbi:hypothetical protein [Amycolatopsis sp. CA-230715]|uniref:hypothetical protein n=1 Tax=Amycolatopsis sp. CA-230715 TaxID=2745196 RepID=UPI001C026B83|nr:hypothetical protein [Amycolatopsis sp. CA-230715]QWF80829.1 hypothetical protein HUW46_04253 [Amycolatopsis sp. CA-230715]